MHSNECIHHTKTHNQRIRPLVLAENTHTEISVRFGG